MRWDPDAVSDEQLERLVRFVLDEQQVENVAGMALTGWDLTDPDAALAELVFDSADEGAVAAGVRSAATEERARTFRFEEVTIDFEESDGRLDGQVSPVPRRVQLQSVAQTVPVEFDEQGAFGTAAPRGLARLVIDIDDRTVVTAWFTVEADQDP